MNTESIFHLIPQKHKTLDLIMGYDLQPHIKLAKIDEIVLLSGNPDRVPVIASHLVNSETIADHRVCKSNF